MAVDVKIEGLYTTGFNEASDGLVQNDSGRSMSDKIIARVCTSSTSNCNNSGWTNPSYYDEFSTDDPGLNQIDSIDGGAIKHFTLFFSAEDNKPIKYFVESAQHSGAGPLPLIDDFMSTYTAGRNKTRDYLVGSLTPIVNFPVPYPYIPVSNATDPSDIYDQSSYGGSSYINSLSLDFSWIMYDGYGNSSTNSNLSNYTISDTQWNETYGNLTAKNNQNGTATYTANNISTNVYSITEAVSIKYRVLAGTGAPNNGLKSNWSSINSSNSYDFDIINLSYIQQETACADYTAYNYVCLDSDPYGIAQTDYDSDGVNDYCTDICSYPCGQPLHTSYVTNSSSMCSYEPGPNFYVSSNVGGTLYIEVTDSTTDTDNNITDWTWTWGDGNTTSLSSISGAVGHTYSSPGNYNVTLSVTDDTGTYTTSVTVVSVTLCTCTDPKAQNFITGHNAAGFEEDNSCLYEGCSYDFANNSFCGTSTCGNGGTDACAGSYPCNGTSGTSTDCGAWSYSFPSSIVDNGGCSFTSYPDCANNTAACQGVCNSWFDGYIIDGESSNYLASGYKDVDDYIFSNWATKKQYFDETKTKMLYDYCRTDGIYPAGFNHSWCNNHPTFGKELIDHASCTGICNGVEEDIWDTTTGCLSTAEWESANSDSFYGFSNTYYRSWCDGDGYVKITYPPITINAMNGSGAVSNLVSWPYESSFTGWSEEMLSDILVSSFTGTGNNCGTFATLDKIFVFDPSSITTPYAMIQCNPDMDGYGCTGGVCTDDGFYIFPLQGPVTDLSDIPGLVFLFQIEGGGTLQWT